MNNLFKQLAMALSCLVLVVALPACSKCCKAKSECTTKRVVTTETYSQDKEADEVDEDDDLDAD